MQSASLASVRAASSIATIDASQERQFVEWATRRIGGGDAVRPRDR